MGDLVFGQSPDSFAYLGIGLIVAGLIDKSAVFHSDWLGG